MIHNKKFWSRVELFCICTVLFLLFMNHVNLWIDGIIGLLMIGIMVSAYATGVISIIEKFGIPTQTRKRRKKKA